MLSRLALVFLVPAFACTCAWAEAFVRWNQAGYRPDRGKVLFVMSDSDLTGSAWRIERVSGDSGAAPPVLQGRFVASVAGAGEQTPLAFNHAVDFSALVAEGRYRFVCDRAAPAALRIAPAPYAALAGLPLRHLRAMRSGTPDVALRRASHLGDATAPVHLPRGDPAEGRWAPAEPARTVDALGGWYDAGDQIKFTLNIAFTSYHLLLAYRTNPALFEGERAASGLPAILDEARHGLEFLARTHPDRTTFIIQVGDARDHEQPDRLPEDDPLDGRRPALCALSRAHMGSAAAALALGARTLREAGRHAEAERYGERARAIFERALEKDTIPSAFERGSTNDFYRDPTDADQLALAGAELHALTGERRFLRRALRLAPPPSGEASWGDWNWLANAALAPSDAGARRRLRDEVAGYTGRAGSTGLPWGLPGRYVWGSLHRWIEAANAARHASLRVQPSPEADALFNSVLDYVFGRNNWGVSFLFSEELPNSVRHLYSPAYRLLGVFPTGALSEGPGDRATHASLDRFFQTPPDHPFHRFNTPAAVFFDRDADFMCQEATIGGQSDLVLMLALASLPAGARGGDGR